MSYRARLYNHTDYQRLRGKNGCDDAIDESQGSNAGKENSTRPFVEGNESLWSKTGVSDSLLSRGHG